MRDLPDDSQKHAVPCWTSRSIFLTSTFRDMHAERDHLRDVVFPALEERARKKHCLLDLVDLRWGVDTVETPEQASKELMVLLSCLDEIDRCHPFQIVILGDRYGWVPPDERLRPVAWLKGLEIREPLSVTALEISYGVHTKTLKNARTLFYLRKALPYAEMSPATAATFSDLHSGRPDGALLHENLERLKASIRSLQDHTVRSYSPGWDAQAERVTGLDAWGNQVLDDVWKALEADLDAGGATETEIKGPAQAAQDLLRDFRGRTDLVDQLIKWTTRTDEETGWGLCLTGALGIGKSAVLARLAQRLREQDCVVLEYYVGKANDSKKLDSVLATFNTVLRAHPNCAEVVCEDNAPLHKRISLFGACLEKVAEYKRVVVILDAPEEIEREPVVSQLSFLPREWPRNARLIVTAESPGAASSWRERGVAIREVPPLDAEEIAEVIDAVCHRHHKALNRRVRSVLLDRRNQPGGAETTGNPLWLLTSLSHLVNLGEDDFLRAGSLLGSAETQLVELLISEAGALPDHLDALCDHVVERAIQFGENHGAPWTSSLFDYLAAGRHGFRAYDLRSLLGCLLDRDFDRALAVLRRKFPLLITLREPRGAFDMGHLAFKNAVLKRRSPEELAQIHRHLASHLEKHRFVSEDLSFTLSGRTIEAVGYRFHSGDAQTQREAVGNLLVAALASQSSPRCDPALQGELFHHLRCAGMSAAALAHWIQATRGERASIEEDLLARIFDEQSTDSTPTLDWLALLAEQEFGSKADDTGAFHPLECFATILASKGMLDAAIRLQAALVRALERPGRACNGRVGQIRIVGALSRWLCKTGQPEAALKFLDDTPSAESAGAGAAIEAELRIAGGDALWRMGRWEEAARSYEEGLAMCSRPGPDGQPGFDASYTRMNLIERLGILQEARNRPREALEHFHRLLPERQRAFASAPDDHSHRHALAVANAKIGVCLLGLERPAEAANSLGDAVELMRPIMLDDVTLMWELHNNLCAAYGQMGDSLGVEQTLEELRVVVEQLRARGTTLPEGVEHLLAKAQLGASLRSANQEHHASQLLGRQADAYEIVRAKFANLRLDLLVELKKRGMEQEAQQQGHELKRLLGVLRPAERPRIADLIREVDCILQRPAAGNVPNDGQAPAEPEAWAASREHGQLGERLLHRGDLARAEVEFRKAVEIAGPIADRNPRDANWQHSLSCGHGLLGEVHLARGQLAEAERDYRMAITFAQRQVEIKPSDPGPMRHLAVNYEGLGGVHEKKGAWAAALEAHRKALAIRQEVLAGAAPPEVSWRREAVVSQLLIGDVLRHLGRKDEASASFQQAYDTSRVLVGIAPHNDDCAHDLKVAGARIMDSLGDALAFKSSDVRKLVGILVAAGLAVLALIAGFVALVVYLIRVL